MTYVSRRTRITVSRWTDECDAEYLLHACRKRSDGRLKRHTSCEDPRAWVNDNCIKNEYLLDLMSNGEFLGKPSFRLYGRFIPVPVLFQLAQSSTTQNNETKSYDKQGENLPGDKRDVREKYSDSTKQHASENLKSRTDSRNENLKVKSDSNLITIQWEKNALEKSLVKCTCLLNKALRQLEKIDGIVGYAKVATDNTRNEEIQEPFYKFKLSCTSSQNQSSSAYSSSMCNFSENVLSSKVDLNIQRAKRTELLRKISGLRKKLKKLRLQEVIHRISSSPKTEQRSPHPQLTELSKYPEQMRIKGPLKNNEKLRAEKKKLVSEMCQAFTALNAIKKYSKPYMESRRRDSMQNENYCDISNNEPQKFRSCSCGCAKCSEKLSDSPKPECFESFSAESRLSKKFDELRQTDDENLCSDYRTSSAEYAFRSSLDCSNLDSEKRFENNSRSSASTEVLEKNSNFSKSNNAFVNKNSKHHQQSESPLEKKSENSKEKGEALNTVKKSKLKFVCEDSPCKKNMYADDLSAFESSPSKQTIILKIVKDIQNIRPSTTPITKREKLESQNYTDEQNSRLYGNILERRVKSEATMKEIEKTLRNYEQRLCDIESLEGRVELLKEKSLEACQLKKRLNKIKADAEKIRAAERENSYRERTRLCWENWELKKEIHRLMKKSVVQSNNIQNLNCTMMKLKRETEELKKELSEYQVDFEYQQNYIFKCECKLAKWGAEIRNLNNHIRKLAAMKEVQCNPCQDSRCIQRSRSYSPENIKERIITNRPKTQARGYRTPSEEEVSCCCREYEQVKGNRNIRQKLLLPNRLLSNSSLSWRNQTAPPLPPN